MVAVPAQQDRCARGQADHLALVAVDLDRVIGPEWLADRQEHRGDEILHRVTHRETDGEADDPGGAENGREQRRGAENIERDHDPGDDGGKLEHGAVDIGDEGVWREPVPWLAASGDQEPEPDHHDEDHKRDRDERQKRHRLLGARDEPGPDRGEPIGHAGRHRYLVLDRHHAVDPLHQRIELFDEAAIKRRAAQGHDPGLDRHGHVFVAVEFVDDIADAGGHRGIAFRLGGRAGALFGGDRAILGKAGRGEDQGERQQKETNGVHGNLGLFARSLKPFGDNLNHRFGHGAGGRITPAGSGGPWPAGRRRRARR